MHPSERERLLLAPYAMHAADSAGRARPEAEHPYRSAFQRDRDRVTHSAAFRRLSLKTQVFTGELAAAGEAIDYHRTRLTHTLEVASIARTVARALRLNEDLVEALALAHDIGHPPFGHAGEEVLDRFLEDDGGFNHNAQALRIVEQLEQRYPDRPGLNLTREVLDGQRSRSKPATGAPARLLETQVVDAADSVAYDAHDADDALELGVLTLDELEGVALWRESADRVRSRFAALSAKELQRATVHDLIDRQVGDLLQTTTAAIADRGVDSAAAARAAGPLVGWSDAAGEQRRQLEAFLFDRVYRNPIVLDRRGRATEALAATLGWWAERVDELPPPLAAVAAEESPRRAVADHVASLTDRAVLDGGR